MKILFFRGSIPVAVLFLFCTVIFFSCKKENSLQQNNSPVSENEALVLSEENTVAEAGFEDISELSLTAGDEEVTYSGHVSGGVELNPGDVLFRFPELRRKIGDCAEITVDPADGTYPKTVIINFGDGCIGRDGKFRKGAIVMHFSGPIRRPGSVLTITFRSFYLGRAHIEGTKIISNLSENGTHKFTVQVVGGKLTFPNGRGFKYDGLKYVKQVGGMDTRIARDDAYEIQGRSKTEYNNGLTVTLNTESPLLKKIGCPWIVKGLLKIKINERTLFLDYGNGDCDNKALLKWSGGEKEITLP